MASGAIGVILDRSWDMGLTWEDQGQFNNAEELGKLLDGVYPWEYLDGERAELIEKIQEQGYIEPSPDADEIECIQIVGDHLYTKQRDIEVMNYCDCLIYDESTKNFLLGFSNTGWLRIDGAIDLATSTVGYFNSIDNIYTPVGRLRDEDIDLLNDVLDADWTIECEVSVKREKATVVA